MQHIEFFHTSHFEHDYHRVKPFDALTGFIDFFWETKFDALLYNISVRTLHRYFETTTAFSCKKALQIMRIRKAVTQLVNSPHDFRYKTYGYHDHSHFYKHLKQFLHKENLQNQKLHLKLLEGLHKK